MQFPHSRKNMGYRQANQIFDFVPLFVIVPGLHSEFKTISEVLRTKELILKGRLYFILVEYRSSIIGLFLQVINNNKTLINACYVASSSQFHSSFA